VQSDHHFNAENMSTSGTYGFIGLGAMGMPIARRLATTIECLAIRDISPERVDLLLDEAGPAAIEDPAILENAAVVFLCLPSQQATRAVVEELATVPGLKRVVIDFGAYSPEFVNEMNAICQAAGGVYCDCPVFGTPLMAVRGELYFLFSGPQKVAKGFEKLATPLGYGMRYAGSSGTASLLKLLQNAIGTANLAIGAEALRICEATGADPNLFIEIVRECGGIGLSSVFDRFADDMAARRDSGEGRLRIAAKDMHSVVSLAEKLNISAPLLVETDRQYDCAMQAGLGEKQFTEIINNTEGCDPKTQA